MTPRISFGVFSSSLRALIGTHSVERMPRSWTLLLLLNRWSDMALLLRTPSPLRSTWLMIVRDAWILGAGGAAPARAARGAPSRPRWLGVPPWRPGPGRRAAAPSGEPLAPPPPA